MRAARFDVTGLFAAGVGVASLVFVGPVLAGGLELQPAMGDPLSDLTPSELARFEFGAQEFDRTFTAEEGLGPVMNEDSCGGCHNSPLGGGGSQFVIRAGATTKSGFDPLESQGGSLFQKLFIDEACEEVIPPEANLITQRVTPGMMGYGLIETIPDADIQALADNQPAGLNGHTHIVGVPGDPNANRVGRFGWKAVDAVVMGFSAGASMNELGITNRFFPDDPDPNGDNPPSVGECDSVPDPEDDGPVGDAFIDHINDFQRFLAPPPQTPKSGMTGEAIFMSIGCGDCHVPQYTTGTAPEAALSNKIVKPYSDFLLHDMGLLGDGIPQGGAGAREFRTTPLMGLRMRDPMIHDGRSAGGTFAARVSGAIAAHDQVLSEGAASAQAFAALPFDDRNHVIAFLASLGRREFDQTGGPQDDGDNMVDVADFVVFEQCYDANGPYTPDDACAISDIDQDGDVDDDDFTYFLQAANPVDCNNNGVSDYEEILGDLVDDDNGNGIPDVCEAVCGNGMIEAGESCDDANNIPDDGCSPECQTQMGYQCAGEPSICIIFCGDGIVLGDEECDGQAGGCTFECLPDCTCAVPPVEAVPTVSTWGLAVLALLLLTAAKLGYGRNDAMA
ncbi:MAG: di-heme oxidoredictase family protein [Planctomycetota bacterium]|jgi:cysteine-rich repeat protein